MRYFHKKDNVLIVMCGIPGSGKSTLARKLAKKENIKICCMDDIREKVLGDAQNQTENEKIFFIMIKHAKRELKKGNSVIIDGTNINISSRKKLLKFFEGLYKESIVYFCDIPLNECKKRNSKRNRKVPDEIIEKYYKKLSPPTTEEGFSYIEKVSL